MFQKDLQEDIRLKYQFGGKNSISVIDRYYFTKRKNPEAENRVTGASSPPFPGQTIEKLKKPKVLSPKGDVQANFPMKNPPSKSQNVTIRKKRGKKKKKNPNSFLSTERTDIRKKLHR